jgi:DNA-binding NarL/FixJ family response regulator
VADNEPALKESPRQSDAQRVATLLLVDDDPQVLAGLRNALHPYRREWTVSEAVDTEDAQRALEKQHFDVVVCDIFMPGPTGDTLLEDLRKFYPDTKRIVLSGISDPKGRAHVTSLCDRFLEKPCNTELLVSTIRALLAEAAARTVSS